jgi:hypothetical protein
MPMVVPFLKGSSDGFAGKRQTEFVGISFAITSSLTDSVDNEDGDGDDDDDSSHGQ